MERPIVDQQDIILAEMRSRILSIRNLRVGDKIATPLAFVVGKCDAWLHLLNGSPLQTPIADRKLDIGAIEENSSRVRAILHEVCPAVLANAEALSENLMFFAVSSFGHTPVKITTESREVAYVPDPAKLQPVLVELPLLWILSQIQGSPLSAVRAGGKRGL